MFNHFSASVSRPSGTSLTQFSNIFPGDRWTIPIIGKFADSMKPTMEGYMKQWNSGALSALSVFNIFIVMASTTEYSRKILNSPGHAEPCLVYSAKQILLPENWVFLTGKEHVAYRRGLNHPLHSQSTRSPSRPRLYFNIMDSVTRKHIKRWLAEAVVDPTEKSMMMRVRDLNMDTSLRVFCGNHLPDEAPREICDKYWDITALPGTKVYRAIQARKSPSCMLDEWVTLLNDPGYKGRREFSDREMAMVLFSFLFASQDAMSSGVIYGFQHLADNPDILAKIREEQSRVRPGQHDKPMTLEDLDQMPYLRAVVKESLRMKPPVTMVPYLAKKAFPISNDYTVPAGSMVIPSFYNSLHDPKNPQNYLVFGSGPHKCVGIEYATMNIALALGLASELAEWKHVLTPRSDKVQIIATIFPQDGCLLKFTPRQYA
ncbi:cytochrome P450 [Lactarius sanguifluus]|nr:cytochrome P450 [Lactarius sanguifluus]